MENDPNPQTQSEDEIGLGGKIWKFGQNITVIRTSGEAETDWQFGGVDDSGEVLVYREIEKGGKHLEKHPSIETFLKWQGIETDVGL